MILSNMLSEIGIDVIDCSICESLFNKHLLLKSAFAKEPDDEIGLGKTENDKENEIKEETKNKTKRISLCFILLFIYQSRLKVK